MFEREHATLLGRGATAAVYRHIVPKSLSFAAPNTQVAVKWFALDLSCPEDQRRGAHLRDELAVWRLAQAACSTVCPLLAVLQDDTAAVDTDTGNSVFWVGCGPVFFF